MPPAAAESRSTFVGKWLLALVVPASGLALGSLPTAALLAVSAVAAVSCALLWRDAELRTTRSSQLALAALTLLLTMTLLQAVPMPAAAVRALAPANADVWDRALQPLHEAAPRWYAISVAPGATRVQLLRGVFYGCVFLGALRLVALDGGARFLERLVVASACIMAITTLAHSAVGAERVFGLYTPRETYAFAHGRYGPLLNKNHLSAYLNVGACVAVGSLVARRTMPRALSLSAALVLAGTSIWAGSRGGAGALLLGTCAAVAMTLWSKRHHHSERSDPAVLALAGVVAAAIVGAVSSDRSRSLANRDFMKLTVALDGLRLVPDSPWFGFGRGAFETVFPTVRVDPGYVTFTHPENIVVQWATEWGVVVAAVASVLLLAAFRPSHVLRAVRPGAGAWVAVVSAVLSDLVDFHLEVPGIVALVAVCAAVALGGRTSRSRHRGEDPVQASRLQRAALALAVVAVPAIVFAVPAVSHSLAEDRRTLGAMAVDRGLPPAQFDAELRAAILRHPGEAFFPLMGAVRAQLGQEGGVVPWVARALERNGRLGRAHLVLARSLGLARAAQARLEYRLAYEDDEALRPLVAAEASRLANDYQTALELVPAGVAGLPMLEDLVKAISPRLPSTAVMLDEELLRRSPDAVAPLRRRIEASLSDTANEHAWCADRACVASGLRDAEVLARREPDQCEPRVLVARWLVADGRAREALDCLEKASDEVTDRGYCQQRLVDMSFEVGDQRRADDALQRLVRSGCGLAADCPQLYQWAAGAAERRNNLALAIALYRRAAEASPDRDDLLEKIAALGEKNGTGIADAVSAYEALSRRHPEDPRWAAKSAELRAGSRARVLALPSSRAGAREAEAGSPPDP